MLFMNGFLEINLERAEDDLEKGSVKIASPG
jgi:hypothetical protein